MVAFCYSSFWPHAHKKKINKNKKGYVKLHFDGCPIYLSTQKVSLQPGSAHVQGVIITSWWTHQSLETWLPDRMAI